MRYMLFIKHTEDYRGKTVPPALMKAMGDWLTQRKANPAGVDPAASVAGRALDVDDALQPGLLRIEAAGDQLLVGDELGGWRTTGDGAQALDRLDLGWRRGGGDQPCHDEQGEPQKDAGE